MGEKAAMGLPRDSLVNPIIEEVHCHVEYFKGC